MTSRGAGLDKRLDRRRLLATGATALGGAGVGWTASAALAPVLDPAAGRTAAGSGTATGGTGGSTGTASPPVGRQLVPFNGAHQAGVVTTPQAHLSLIGLDLRPGTGRAELVRLMRLLSDDASRLTSGVAALADTEPELGGEPASLTVTFGFGPRVMRELLGASYVPALPAFRTDRLLERWGQTDLAVQLCADDPLTIAHARRMLLKDSHSFATLRWTQDGFRRARGVAEGASVRNVMGQVDGTGNPAPTDADFDRLLWSQEDGFAGGTTMVVRRIRTHLDTWDKVDRSGREAVIGRRLSDGAPLTGTKESDPADFAATDDLGLPVIDPASHIARAHARTPDERFLRRPYNYVVPDPHQPTGEDAGLVFVVFAADAQRQFVPVQRRLAESDRLNQWVTTIGSAVYAVPPGAAEGEYVGQRLLSA